MSVVNRLPALAAIVCLATPSLPRAGVATDSPGASAPALGTQDAAILLDVLRRAGDQGFGADEFPVGEAADQLRSNDPSIRRQGGRRLTAAAIAYAHAQRGGRVAPSRFLRDWAIRPAPYDAKADFEAALAGHQLATWARRLPPPDQRYDQLVQVLARYEAIAAQSPWPVLAVKPGLKLGATGPRVQALRQRLALEEPSAAAPASAAPGGDSGPAAYDAALAAAVARAQARYGLEPDGIAGAATLAALNVPVEERLGQIRANLERWRWAPRELPPYRVELNIADASLQLYDGGKPALAMRAIVGRASKPTPMFQDQIRAVVFNPPWNVPADIAAKEIWPKIRRDPGYMAREGFVVRPGGGLQQLPGPNCALGTIKFDLSNSFGVYLHDTPARTLFARDSRTLSHGCMRVEKPNALAKRVLQANTDWPEAKIDLILISGNTVRAPLREPVPVYVFYWTVFVNQGGQVQFRSDVYHWDRKLLETLRSSAH